MSIPQLIEKIPLQSSKESRCYFESDNDDNTKPVTMDLDCIGELHGVSCSKLSVILKQQKRIGSNNINNDNNHQYQQKDQANRINEASKKDEDTIMSNVMEQLEPTIHNHQLKESKVNDLIIPCNKK